MTIILQHSHLIHNLLKLLLIPKPNLINVHKRFYPKGKEVGHASKILNATRTPSTGLPPTTSPQVTSYPKSMANVPSQAPTTPSTVSLSKCHVMDQNKAVQKTLKDVQDHQVFAQKYTTKKEQQQTEFDIKDIALPQTLNILTKHRILTQNVEHNKKTTINDTHKVETVKTEELQKDITEISPSEDSLYISLPVPRLPTQSNNTSSPINFSQEISQKYQEREQRSENIMKTINDLEIKQAFKNHQNLQISQLLKYNLLKFDEITGERLIKECFLTWKKIYEKTILINISDEIKDCNFDLGLLKIHNEETTLLLTGLQKHVVVLYTTIDHQKIVWGYLTSEYGNNNKLLSTYQPFLDKLQKNKDQYIYPFKQPLKIDNSDIIQLPEKLQIIGENYLKDENIKQILKSCFKNEILPLLKNPISVYDGIGLTEQNLNEILLHYKKKEDKLALKWFHEFKFCTTEEKKQRFWNQREKDKNTHVRAHEYFNQLINNEKDKHK